MKIPRFLRSILRIAAPEAGRYALHAARLRVGADHRTTVDVTDGRTFVRVVTGPNELDEPVEVLVWASDLARLLGARGDNVYGGRTIEDDGYEEEPYVERDVDLGPDLSFLPGALGSGPTALYTFDAIEGTWPDRAEAIWPTEAPIARIPVNIAYLIAVLRAAQDASVAGHANVVLSINSSRPMVPNAKPIPTLEVQARNPRTGVEVFAAVLAGVATDMPAPYRPGAAS